ncbi:MAG: glycosyltransferase family 39 protein [Lacunisphaera sp.]
MVPAFIQVLKRSDVRLACFGLSAVVAVYFGFLGLGVAASGTLVERFGYYFMLITFALWVKTLFGVWRSRNRGERMSQREVWGAGLVIGVLSIAAFNSEPFRSKILYDEYVLQSTAYNMHYFRDAATMVRGYDILGDFISTDSYLDKRPNFFPFLISLVHDLTGYRTENAYWLNSGLYPLALVLAYGLGRRLNGPKGGFLAIVLLGSLPLLSQNATGSGMELINIAMILVVVLLGSVYLRRPDEERLSALVIGAVLLAQTRYESAIYVLPVAVMILVGWWRTRGVMLSWAAVVAPLLLLPSALQNKVLSNSRWMWELKENQNTRFSPEYVMGNVHSAIGFFFNTSARLANSWLLTILGAVSLAYLMWRLVVAVRRRADLGSDRWALLLMSAGVLSNTVLILFYYWSNLEDPIASRLSLPFYLFLSFAVVIAASSWDRRFPATAILTFMVATVGLTIGMSHQAQHLYSYLGSSEIEWEKRYVASLPEGDRLIITNKSTMPWLLNRIPSILIGRTNLVGDRLHYQIERHTFCEILVFQSLRPGSPEGDHELVPEDRVPAGFKLEVMTEKRFGTKIDRVSRLVAVALPSNKGTLLSATP